MITARIVTVLGAALLLTASVSARASETVDTWLGDIQLPTANYINDGSFEHAGKGWTWFVHKGGEITTDHAAGGNAAFRMGTHDPDRTFYYYQYNLPLETGQTYTFSATIKSDNVDEAQRAFGMLFLTDYGWTGRSISLSPVSGTSDWTRVSKTFVAPESKARPDGKPTYHLVIYWPPERHGSVWFDDIQVEKGDTATPYSDVYVGDGIAALEQLRPLAEDLFASLEALDQFKRSPMIAELRNKLRGIRMQAEAVRDDLKAYATLTAAEREKLASRVNDAATELARLRTLMWTGPAHIPLNEVALPASVPDAPAVSLTCLRGEHRDIALNIAPLQRDGYAIKLTPTGLYQRELALTVPAPKWIDMYTVPLIRGSQMSDATFTDPLPQLNAAGICQVMPGRINQVMLSIDTTDLPPGMYEGSVDVASLRDADNRRSMNVKLTVLPEAILPITDVAIAECFGHVDYAWQAMIDLGVNTFDIDTMMIDIAFDEHGNVAYADFMRTDARVRQALADVPHARFMFFSGETMVRKIMRLTGFERDDPRVGRAFKGWVRAIVDHFATLGVEPNRLVMETYDEPQPGDYVAGTQQAHWIDEVEPAIETHFYASGVLDNDAWKNHARAHDIVAPIVHEITDQFVPMLHSLGKTLWVYDCQADGESFHPIAYYRLMPWMCRKYDIVGWGHFSWFNTSHGRAYKVWEGVEAQNLVYPTADGEGMVISRRYLAMRAGHEDYRVLDALERVAARSQSSGDVSDAIGAAYDVALRMSPRQRGYQTHIEADAPPDLLDTLRADLVNRAAAMVPAPHELVASLDEQSDVARLTVDVPEAGELHVRYLIDGQLPWQSVRRRVDAGKADVLLDESGEHINRCLVEVAGDSGKIYSGSAGIIPLIAVDSTAVPYDARNLNDGIRIPSVKFEPKRSWISEPAPGEHWVELDLGRERTVSEVRLDWMTYMSLPQRVGLRYLDSNGAWQNIPGQPQWRPASEPVETIRFDALRTSKLRVVQDALGGGVGAPTMMGLGEIEVK